MGNDHSKKDQSEQKSIELHKIGHEKFNHFNYNESEDLIEVTIDVESERDVKNWRSELRQVDSFEDKETLLLPVRDDFTARGFCGNVGSAKLSYENYPYLFEEEIQSRMSMGKFFEQQQLMYLLYCLVCSARDFSKIERKIGDVRPYNIFINQEGQIKIANIFSWPYEKTNFEKTAFEKQLTYLAPEEMRIIAKGNHDNNTDRITSESFSIGLTLLQSALLTNVKEIYSLDHYSVDLNKLNQKLNEWQTLQFPVENYTWQTYSPLLKQIVTLMCNPDQRQRLRSLEVEELLRPYQNEIFNLRKFDHRNIPLFAKQPQNQQIQQLQVQQVQVQQIQPPQAARPVMARPPQSNYPVQQTPVQTANTLNYQQTNTLNYPQQVAPYQMPQRVINVTNPLEPKYNQIDQRPFQAQDNNIRFNIPEPKLQFPQVPNQAYQQHFYKYAHINNTPISETTILPPAGQAPTYYKPNETTTQNFQANTTTFRPPTIGLPTNPFSKPIGQKQPAQFSAVPLYKPPVFDSNAYTSAKTNVITSQYTSYPLNVAQSSQVMTSISGAPDSSSDFLRKIDEQLQNSRRQFPS